MRVFFMGLVYLVSRSEFLCSGRFVLLHRSERGFYALGRCVLLRRNAPYAIKKAPYSPEEYGAWGGVERGYLTAIDTVCSSVGAVIIAWLKGEVSTWAC
jgi:hypothetical protein